VRFLQLALGTASRLKLTDRCFLLESAPDGLPILGRGGGGGLARGRYMYCPAGFH
jgi:hypothetical protein